MIPYQMADQAKLEEIRGIFQEVFKTKTRDEWFEYLWKWEVEVGPVLDDDELDSDPQIQHRNMLLEIEHPVIGKVRHVGIPVKLSDTPGAIRGHAPALGQDTEEVLRGLGYSREQIDELRKIGAAG